MRKINIGIVFDQKVVVGGGYQQAVSAAITASKLPATLAKAVYFSTLEENINVLEEYGIEAVPIKLNLLQYIWTHCRRKISSSTLYRIIKKIDRYSPFERFMIENEIDLVYFLSPCNWAQDIEELNYITTVWDLCHRDELEFPEVRKCREFDARENNYKLILPRAIAIIVDSELGKDNVIKRYNIDHDRIYIIPFEPSVSARMSITANSKIEFNVLKKYLLETPYIFYPAQFWAHKNHVYILKGLHILEQRYGIKIGAIFSGGDQGNLNYVQSIACELNLQNRVRFTGFVNNSEIIEFYKQAIALVMPSYFGPTNIPPLEAFTLGVPVLYSDKVGMREQVANAALLMDLENPESMANHLKKLIYDDQLRTNLIEAGNLRAEYFNSIDRVAILKSIVMKFSHKRIAWN